MKKTVMIAAALLLLAAFASSQAPLPYETRFTDKALRLDLYQVGDAAGETLTIDAVYEEPLWPETPDPAGRSRSATAATSSRSTTSLRTP